MTPSRTVRINVQADDNFTKTLTASTNGLQTFVRGIYGASGSVGLFGANMFQARAAIASFASGVGLAGIAIGAIAQSVRVLGDTIKTSLDFEDTMIRLRNNMDITDAQFNRLRQDVRSMAVETGQDMTDLGTSYRVAQNELANYAQSQDAVRIANMASVATGAQVVDVTKSLTQIVRDFNIPGQDMAKTMEQIYIASRDSNTTMDEFVSVGGRAYAEASALGIPLHELLAAMSALGTTEAPARAVTGLTTAIAHMADPTTQEAKELKRLSEITGKDLVYDFSAAGLKSQGLDKALQDLKDALNQVGDAEALKLVPAIRGGIELMALAGPQWDNYRRILGEVGGATNDAAQLQRGYNDRINDGKTAFNQLGQASKDLAISMGDVLAPAAVAAARGLESVAIQAKSDFASIVELIPFVDTLAASYEALNRIQQASQGRIGINEGGPSVGTSGYYDELGNYHPPSTGGLGTPGMPGGARPFGSTTTIPGVLGPPEPTAEQIKAQAEHNIQLEKTAAQAKYAGYSLDQLKVAAKEGQAQIDFEAAALDKLQSALDTDKIKGNALAQEQDEKAIAATEQQIKDDEAAQRALNGVLADAEAAQEKATNATKAQTAALQEQRDAVSDLRTALGAAQQALSDFQSAQIRGTQGYKDRTEAIDEQINRQQLAITTARLQLRPGQADTPQIRLMDQALQKLQLQKQQVQQQEAVNIGPQEYQRQHAIDLLQHPEMNIGDILSGISAAGSAINTLKPIVDKEEGTAQILKQTVDAIRAGKAGVGTGAVSIAQDIATKAISDLEALIGILAPGTVSGKKGPLSLPGEVKTSLQADFGGGDKAAALNYLQMRAAQLGLDPAAVMAVASQEGLGGGIGDLGTSFGPFQLHAGGALPSEQYGGPYSAGTQAWAWSTGGIDYALAQIAGVASGLTGEDAIRAIVTQFERPANASGEIQGAIGALPSYQLPTYAGGGSASNVGLGQPLLAVLHGGEYVLTTDQVRAFQQAGFPFFQGGGPVGPAVLKPIATAKPGNTPEKYQFFDNGDSGNLAEMVYEGNLQPPAGWTEDETYSLLSDLEYCTLFTDEDKNIDENVVDALSKVVGKNLGLKKGLSMVKWLTENEFLAKDALGYYEILPAAGEEVSPEEIQLSPVERAFVDASKQWIRTLTQDEINALEDYTNASAALNRYLRTGAVPTNIFKPGSTYWKAQNETIAGLPAMAAAIWSGLQKSTLDNPLTVYRGFSSDELSIGQEVPEPAIVSTTLEKKIAEGFALSSSRLGVTHYLGIIDVPPNAKAAYLGDLPGTDFSYEKEVLLPGGGTYTVTGFDKPTIRSGEEIVPVHMKYQPGPRGVMPVPLPAGRGGFEGMPDWITSISEGFTSMPKFPTSGGFTGIPDWMTGKSGGFTGFPSLPKSGGFSPLPPELAGGIPQFALGGTVPGPLGWPRLGLLHGGEHVSTAAEKTGSGVSVNFNGPLIGQATIGNELDLMHVADELGNTLIYTLDHVRSQGIVRPAGVVRRP